MVPFGQTITVSRSGGTSWNGDPLPSTTHTIKGCAIWQSSTSEDMQGRDVIVTTTMLAVPYGSDIVATDMVYLPDDDTDKPAYWQVNGDPFPWRSPFTGWRPGTQVQLQRVVG